MISNIGNNVTHGLHPVKVQGRTIKKFSVNNKPSAVFEAWGMPDMKHPVREALT
ncbi:hypothetical protein MASR1M90_04510 [Desulfovibrionales bacterium]